MHLYIKAFPRGKRRGQRKAVDSSIYLIQIAGFIRNQNLLHADAASVFTKGLRYQVEIDVIKLNTCIVHICQCLRYIKQMLFGIKRDRNIKAVIFASCIICYQLCKRFLTLYRLIR